MSCLSDPQTWEVTVVYMCERHGAMAFSNPATDRLSLALTFLHLTQTLITFIPPFPLHQIYEVINATRTPAWPLQHKAQRRLWPFVQNDRNLFFSLFPPLYKSEWCREKCIDFEGWLQNHHRLCAQNCPRQKADQYFSYSAMVKCYRPESSRSHTASQPAWRVVPKRAILIKERHSIRLRSLLSSPSATLLPLLYSFLLLLSSRFENWWIWKVVPSTVYKEAVRTKVIQRDRDVHRVHVL